MSDTIDLRPATTLVAEIVAKIGDDDLDRPTPCPVYRVGDLLDHVANLCTAFALAAAKQPMPSVLGDTGGRGDAARLGPEWRTEIPTGLAHLAAAWDDPDAWTGATAAGGVEMPGEIAGLVALNEVVVHGWDLAVAVGRNLGVDMISAAAATAFVAQFPDDARGDAFGPALVAPVDATALDRLIALNGRNPRWSP